MNYQFPTINHIDDVLVAIKDSPEFIVVQKDGYQVVNYLVVSPETFPPVIREKVAYGFDVKDHLAAVRRECRGLVFDLEGNLINRRYHKFFNVNEREETLLEKIDWNKPHIILEKLDGSMVTPCYVNGHIRWMTKMGITDTSMEAEAFVAKHPKYVRLAEALLHMDFTPIFEWCSNKNRIVLAYPEDRLVLTGVRSNDDGSYWSHSLMMEYAQVFADKIPVVRDLKINKPMSPQEILDFIRVQENAEGVVVRFDDGHMVKIKADWYVRIHKVKSYLENERDVTKLILNNELDDLMPVLPPEDVERIKKFEVQLLDAIRKSAWTVYQTVMQNRSTMDRKTFAINFAPTFNPLLRGLVFKFWDTECDEHLTYAAVVATIVNKCGNNKSYAEAKEAFLWGVEYV